MNKYLKIIQQKEGISSTVSGCAEHIVVTWVPWTVGKIGFS